MKTLTAEWVAKAEGDFATMQRERRARKNPNYDGVCFHAQQCAEKYLKALLQEAGLPIKRTHNLLVLLNDALPAFPFLELMRENLKWLENYAVAFRYPGETASKKNAVAACAFCASIREIIRAHLECS